MRRKLGFEFMIAAICVTATSCSMQSNNMVPSEILQTEETANTELLENLEQALSGTIAAGRALREQLNSVEKTYTFGETIELLYEHEMEWEAYYNISGERIDMYWEDGTELMFLSSDEDAESDDKILVMLNDQFYKLGFQEAYQIELEPTAELEYFPQTAAYYLSEAEMMAMNQTDLKIALHEIYARHGKQITETFLQAVFNQKTWYVPAHVDVDFVSKQDELLNEYEKENAKAILAIQKKRRFVEDLEVDYKVPRSVVECSDIDLDGDGSRESLLFDFHYAGPYDLADGYYVMINPKVPGDFALSGAIDEMPIAIYTASLDGKTTQLIMSGKMNDGKPRTDIYVYQDGEARLAGQIDAGNLEIMEDCFWAYQYDKRQINLERAKYIFENGTVIETGVTEAVEDENLDDDNGMITLIDSFDFEHSRITYSEVVAAFEQIGVSWEGTLNISGERLDIICDDGTYLILMETGLAEKELIMAGDRLSERGFKRVFIHEQVAEPGDFYYPQTAERLLADDELGKMNQTELAIARNEIYARHGRRFVEPYYHAVFSRKSWYKPKYDGTEFSGKVNQLLNYFEKENLLLLVAAEKGLHSAAN